MSNSIDALPQSGSGIVYLIGAGPGDPGLITVRGVALLSHADVVVYDRLAHPALLRHVRPEAECIYVGKASAHHAMKQEEINSLLVARALQGKIVARLKGGDPLVFGRGGEEAEACRTANIPFEFVPGVTSAIAAPAYAGIPVTHRDAASSFAVITGHERDDSRESGHRAAGTAEQRRNWAAISHAADTLIFLMGVEALSEIVARLMENGRTPDTPVGLVQWGTWPMQRTVTGTLATIVEIARESGITPPAVCVVGEVVKLRSELRWFDDPRRRPLQGKRVVVTRAREQASQLSDLLHAHGADPLEFPVIKIEPVSDYGPLDAALNNLAIYSWMALTSTNAISFLAERLEALQLDARAFATTKIAAIGPATAQALRSQLGLKADFVPTEAVAEAMVEQWPDPEMAGKRVLLPRAAEARELLPEQLQQRGAHVDVIPTYVTTMDGAAAESFRQELQRGACSMLTFTASSTVHNFVRALTNDNPSYAPTLVGSTPIAAIGPITADTLRNYNLEPQVVATEHTMPGLVQAIESYFRAKDNVNV